MKKLLKKLIDQTYQFNTILKKPALAKNYKKEEAENLVDFLETKKKLEELLNTLSKRSPGNVEQDNKDLMELHVLMDNMSWYFQNLHENVMSVFKHYPDNSDKN